MRLVGRTWIVLLCALVLAACGADTENDAPVVDSTPAATPPPSAEMVTGNVIWAEALDEETGEPTAIVSRFTTQSPAIIAVIEVSDIPADTEFTATWTINDQPIDVSEMDITASEDLPHAWIAFQFTRDAGHRYPVGQLGVVITTSDGEMREATIEIGFP